MNEPAEMMAEDARRQAGQALLLARVFATAVTLLLLLLSLLAGSSASRYGVMFSELGMDAELPVISTVAVRSGGALMLAMLVLAAVTVFFIWARGKAAAWMAGLGALLLALSVGMMVVAMILPLLKIVTEMGSM